MNTPRQLSLDLQVVDAPPATIEYTVRESSRTRRVILRVVPGRGLVVTVPRRYPKHQLKAIITARREWILEALADIDARLPAEFRQWPPESLDLIACSRRVSLVWQSCAQDQRASVQWQSDEYLALSVDSASREQVAQCMAAALKPLARQILVPWLARLAQRHGLSYTRVVVRGQRSVWGSYSSSGTLSLNYKLLFLPPELVDYVLLHELAHTRHLDHSTAFWSLLEQMVPGARALDKALTQAASGVPPWLELAR